MLMQSWQLNRTEAASVAGLSEAKLKNYQTRYAPFPEKKEGTGRQTTYDFGDIMKLAVLVQMLEDGFSPQEASAILSNYSPYGTMLHNPAIHSVYPGTFFISKGPDGLWHASDGENSPSRYEVRMWALYDRVWPRFEQAVMSSDGYAAVTRAERLEALDAFKRELDELRSTRTSSNPTTAR